MADALISGAHRTDPSATDNDKSNRVSSENIEQSAPAPKKSPGRFARLSWWKKGLLLCALVTPPAVGGLWIAVHSIPWMGPLVANTLRSVVGKENVTRLEDFVYSIEDRVNRTLKADEKPKSYWEVPAKSAAPLPPPTPAAQPSEEEAEDEAPQLSPFAPPTPGPVNKEWSAEGDGQWVPIVDPRRPEESPRLFKTLLHPDSSRSWAELFVVAVDLRQVEVMPVMGYQEPRTEKPEAADYQRSAKIPPQDYEALLGAFNGGFMAEHGGYGVYFDGISFIDAKDDACTLAYYKDGSFRVATWAKIKDGFEQMQWYRQAPGCMYEDGVMHPSLKVHRSRKWGATLDGNTVIRRSAVGLSKDRQILYVGISNHTTAKVMAAGMNHAGADNVAQMDVNWSYPKFVTYEPDKKGTLHPVALADGFEFSDALYLRERSMRDFFYLARKEEVSIDVLPTAADEKAAPAEESEAQQDDSPEPDQAAEPVDAPEPTNAPEASDAPESGE